MLFNEQFDNYACPDDTISVDVDGFTVTARIVYDQDSHITDDDSHNTDQAVTGCNNEQQARLLAARDAWFKDEWFYCGIVLSVAKNGVTLDNHAASLWGIECNYPGSDNSYLTEVANDLLPEALDAGRIVLAKLSRHGGLPAYESVRKEIEANYDLQRFTNAYIEALYFAETGDDEQPPNTADLAPETLADIEADCRSFWRRFGCYILTDECRSTCSGDPVEYASHDFHLTRNGHGVGFWDTGRWPETYADMLDQGAQSYGAFNVYVGDDGLLYGST